MKEAKVLRMVNKSTKFSPRWLIAVLIILISITMYKFAGQDATEEPIATVTSSEVLSAPEQQTGNDPFKEALERQASLKPVNQEQHSNLQRTQSKDPFKEFLDKQSKELNSSKVSPFEVVK